MGRFSPSTQVEGWNFPGDNLRQSCRVGVEVRVVLSAILRFGSVFFVSYRKGSLKKICFARDATKNDLQLAETCRLAGGGPLFEPF